MNGKRVLITGASRGIGRALALAFAAAGYDLVLQYRSNRQAMAETLQSLASYDVACQSFAVDLSQETAVEDFLGQIGAIDVLVNNAGIAQQKLFTDITTAEWDEMFAVDVRAVFWCTKGVLPDMIRRKKGRIINISSIWGLTGASCEVHYSAAKAAVIGMTKALAKELAPSGITVNCIAPGVVDTDMNAHLSAKELADLAAEIPAGRFASPAEIASAALFFASEQAGYITGQILSPNGGFVV